MIYLLIGFAFLFSLGIAYFQYYFRRKQIRFKVLLFSLKTGAFFLLLLLLINPKIKIKEFINEKPILNFLVDNSSSIKYFKDDDKVKSLLNTLKTNTKLADKFSIKTFQFDETLHNNDSLSFTKNNTNIYKALESVNDINKNKIAPIILLSDGNQTVGSDYEYFSSQQDVYPILIGDTTKYVDLKISLLNANKYSFIENQFPVEVILNYEGKEEVTSQFIIQKQGKVVYRKNVKFSETKKTETIKTNLSSKEEGIKFYSASITPLQQEKNKENNKKVFSVEVINEQSKTLIISSIVHPDLGALKNAIASNKKNSVEIVSIDNYKQNLLDYQLVILYQPNIKFKNVITKVKENAVNYLLISGSATDWSFLNSQNLGYSKNSINQLEDYTSSFNDSYQTFIQNDIGFDNFPPLKDKFGRVSLSKDYQVLFYQNINGVSTNEPLLATFSENNQKVGLLLGENIWKWRAASFLSFNSFSDFDEFIGNLIQYLASTKKRNRLEVNTNSIYRANSNVDITAFYTDKNYKFDARANLEVTLINEKTNEVKKFPLSLNNSSFKVSIENLYSGNYSYIVNVIGQNISRKGMFRVSEFDLEKQFTKANSNKLSQLASNSNAVLTYPTEVNNLINTLLTKDEYVTIQKQNTREQPLINWKWILFFIIILLSAEWFLRKYIGKI